MEWTDGLSGNEDCGQMSSWYVLSAMGMYSVTPGSDIYTFGSPVFEEVKINLENGKNFVIKSPGCGDHMFIENIKLDKELHHKLFITSERLNAGGQLDFTMSRLEQKGFCIDPQCRPVSRDRRVQDLSSTDDRCEANFRQIIYSEHLMPRARCASQV